MSLARLLNRPSTIVHRHEDPDDLDDYGNPKLVTDTSDVLCYLEQQQRREQGDRGQVGEDVWLYMVPAGTVLDANDQVVVDDVVYELDGPPWEAMNPRLGTESHVEATLRRSTTTEGASS